MQKNIELENVVKVDGSYDEPIAFSSQFYFCGCPLRLDSYQGCGHRCSYCFANLRKGNNFEIDRTTNYTPANVKTIKRTLSKSLDKEDEYQDLVVNTIRKYIPLHWGGMADPFPPIENVYGVSLEIAKILEQYDYPMVISTKGKAFLENRYLKQFSNNKCLTQFSIMNSDERIIKRFEPGASSLSERKEQIKNLVDMDMPVSIRLQPFIPINFNIKEYVEMVKDLEVKYVTIECLKLPLNDDQINEISNCVDLDIKKEFKRISGNLEPVKVYGREFELPAPVKHRIIINNGIKKMFNDEGIKVGMGDNQLHNLNDGKCCCGIDTLTDFNILEANYTAMFKRKDDEYYFDDLVKGQFIPEGQFNHFWDASKHKKFNNDIERSFYKPDNLTKVNGKYNHSIINMLYWKWINPELNDVPSETLDLNYNKTLEGKVYHSWGKTKQGVLDLFS